MKKNFLLALLGIVAMLTSCNKEEVGSLATNKTTSFNVSVDDGVQTRAIVSDLSRFVMEVYKGNTAIGTPEKHIEQANGLFKEVLLEDKQAYTVLFWADYGTPGTAGANNANNEYDASNLQAARVVAGKQPTKAAYSGVSKFTVGTDVEAVYTQVTLTHSVAQVNFIQTEALTTATNKLVVSYSKSYSVNVSDNIVTEIVGTTDTHSFDYTNTATGILGTSYLIAGKNASKTLLDITAKLNSETAKTVSNVPFERNFKTSISGAYSSKYAAKLTVTCDDVWGTPDNNVWFPKAKVGDFYYSDKTFSTTYDQSRTCIGIVFVVNADGKTGKIVSLNEMTNTVWSTEKVATGTDSEMDGATNTDKIVALNTYNATVYPPVAWCVAKNTPTTAGIRWYLPAVNELQQLYAAMSGLKWVASGVVAGEGEISEWEVSSNMPNYETYANIRTAFNSKFTTAQGSIISETNYLSSYALGSERAYQISFGSGHQHSMPRDSGSDSVRAVSAF